MQDFFGSDFSPAYCDVLAMQHIKHAEMRRESELYRRKWFDYRGMHPVVATYCMAHCYNQAYGRFMMAVKDRGLIHMKGFKGKDVLESREKTGFWRLRQKADEAGMRYEFLLDCAMSWCIDNGWLHAPRPQHIYSNADMWLNALNRWEQDRRQRIHFATSARYQTANFVGAPDQLAYEQFIVEQIKQRQNRHYALNSALYHFDAIRIEMALKEFGGEATYAAINYCLTE